MGILRLLLGAIVILLIALAILPKTNKEQIIERRVLKGTITFCIILIMVFSVALFHFKDTLWQSDPYNHPLVQKIMHDRFIKEITINNLDMQSINAAALEEVISKNKTLNTIIIKNISENNINTIINGLSKNKHLSTLEIKELPNNSCKKIADTFTQFNITQLRLTNLTTLGTNIIFNGITKHKNITHLTLKDIEMNNESARLLNTIIKTSKELYSLNLSFNGIDDEYIKIIATSLHNGNKLSILNLWGNNISDEGLKVLVKSLQNNVTIKTLLLGYNNISDAGIKYISNLILNNKTLKIIDLTRNEISDNSAYAISKTMSKNNTLEKIILRSTLFTESKIKKLQRELKSKNETRIIIETN